MEIIKKNIKLLLVLSVSLGVSMVLGVLAIGKSREMAKAIGKVDELKKEISELNAKQPSPSEDNLDAINEDCARIREKIGEVQQLFGKPYYPAFREFAMALGIEPLELEEKWRSFWNQHADGSSEPSQILIKFLEENDYSGEVREKAALAFKEKMTMTSFEKLENEKDVIDMLLVAMGVPREMSDIQCKSYMVSLMEDMRASLKGAGISVAGGCKYFSFDRYEKEMPRKVDIPRLLQHWRMLDDLCRRLRASKVSAVLGLTKKDFFGKDSDDYRVFEYTITVEGGLDAIRSFMNSLKDAFRDNQIYIVRNVELRKAVDAVPEIKSEEKSAAEAESSLPIQQRKGYGRPIIGRSRAAIAEITFDYVLYIGNALKVNKNN